MISHVTLGTNDLDRAAAFYEPIMSVLGNPRVPFERSDPFIMWRRPGDDRPLVALTRPFNGEPHDPGNGQMLALLAPDRESVDAGHVCGRSGRRGSQGTPALPRKLLRGIFPRSGWQQDLHCVS